MITRYTLLPGGGHYAPHWADSAYEAGHEENDGMWICADIPEQFFGGLPPRYRTASGNTPCDPITLVLSGCRPRGKTPQGDVDLNYYEVRATMIDSQLYLELLDLADEDRMTRLTPTGTVLTNYVFIGPHLYRAVRDHATRRATPEDGLHARTGSHGKRVREPSGRAFLWIEL